MHARMDYDTEILASGRERDTLRVFQLISSKLLHLLMQDVEQLDIVI